MRGIGCLAMVACAVSLAGCGEAEPPQARVPPERVKPEAARAVALIRDIPQQNYFLGKPDADATLTVFADPYCVGQDCLALGEALQSVISRYVRPGRLRLELRPLATPSYPVVGLREAFAASLQDKLWDYALAFQRVQDFEIDPRRVAAAVPGLDQKRMRADAGDARVREAIAKARRLARERKASVPSVFLAPAGGGDARRLSIAALSTRQGQDLLLGPARGASP